MDVARNMRPEGETGEPMIYKSKPAKYVLEVKSGVVWNGNLDSCLKP